MQMYTDDKDQDAPLTFMGRVTIVILLGFLLISLWYAVHVWTSMPGVRMSGWGWLSLVLGIVVTIALGAGLMALVFYSSRHDMDR